MPFETLENKEILLEWRPNRALGASGRAIWIGLLSVPPMMVAAACAWLGAWPVVPFAGVEFAVVVWAFHWIARGDGDFERVALSEHGIGWTCRRAGRVESWMGNRLWARVMWSPGPGPRSIELHHAGKVAHVGAALPEVERQRLFEELGRRLRQVGAPHAVRG